ncbi:hypothetical protein LWI28_007563 [Acer negundo]|uniref:Uncharacterized protein n=1 Tax=Acer negundo TaxID=4023 RepID=A0AAD5IUQ6_ACENE|nr:hypothetical protein LWI28_007563 [Acer negundo]
MLGIRFIKIMVQGRMGSKYGNYNSINSCVGCAAGMGLPGDVVAVAPCPRPAPPKCGDTKSTVAQSLALPLRRCAWAAVVPVALSTVDAHPGDIVSGEGATDVR